MQFVPKFVPHPNFPKNRRRTRTPRITTWTYDAAYRLASETITAGSGDGVGSAGSVSYGHNGVGNRQHRTVTGGLAASLTTIALGAYTYDVRDRLRTAGASSFGYDENGSTTSATHLPAAEPLTRTASSVADTYAHDNRLLQRTETGPSGRTITVLYDADGNRVRKTVATPGQPTRTTWYVVDTQNPTGYAQVLEEHEQFGNGPIAAKKFYAYGHDLIAQHVWEENPATINTPATTGWQTRYHGYDGHGSVRYLTNPAGAITDTYTYDAYGILLVATSTGPSPTDNTYLYAGEQWDPDLRLYYNRARYLNPETGRFWSNDDYEGVNTQPATLHKYLYAHADPVNGIDPSGHFTLMERLVVASAVTIVGLAQTSLLPYHRNGQPVSGGFGSQEAGDDVTAGIVSLLNRVDNYYRNLPLHERQRLARNLLHWEQANGMWDILPLSLAKLDRPDVGPIYGLRTGGGEMKGTVTFMQRPVYAVSLNYIIFGRIVRLINDDPDIGSERYLFTSDVVLAAVFFRQDIQLAIVRGSQPLLTHELRWTPSVGQVGCDF